MPWLFKFEPPIVLKDGRRLETLADARALVFLLPIGQLESLHFMSAVRLLEEASRDWMIVSKARAQLVAALKAEGLY